MTTSTVRMAGSEPPSGRTAVVEDQLGALFPDAAPASRRALSSLGRTFEFERGDTVLDELGPPAIALLRDGYAGTWRSDLDGRSQLVALHGRGELMGLPSLGPHRRPVRVVALSCGAATAWPADRLLGLARSDPGLAVDLLAEVSLASERLLTRLEHVGFDPVARRLARLLWQRRDVLFDPQRPLLTRPQLADLAGATREMTDRVIRGMEADGIVRRVGRTGLVLCDEEALRRLADASDDDRDCS